MILVDTDICIDFLRDFEPGVLFFAQNSEKIVLSEFTVLELIKGWLNQRELNLLDKFTERFKLLSANSSLINRAINILKIYSLKYGMDLLDALIAATAIENGIPLYTRNQKYFKKVKGLDLIKPY